MSEIRLIVGLGNPGREYELTRHNLGFLAVQKLAEKIKFKFSLSSLTNGLTAEGVWGGSPLCLLAPMTYMNNSGVAVKQVMIKKELTPAEVLIVCDDFHLAFQQSRLRSKGSDGGHNGLKSVIQHLDADGFARLRLGIGRPTGKKDTVDYVLEEFKKDEKAKLDDVLEEAASCCLMCLKDGLSAAMDLYNRKT